MTEEIEDDGGIPELQLLFPHNTKIINFDGTYINYETDLRIKAKNKYEFQQWLEKYQKISSTTWRIRNTCKTKGITVLYKASYRCHHNTYPRKSYKGFHRKHTNCQAILKVIIKSSDVQRKMRSKDILRQDFPTLIKIKHIHNHGNDIIEERFNIQQYSDINIKLDEDDIKSEEIQSEINLKEENIIVFTI